MAEITPADQERELAEVVAKLCESDARFVPSGSHEDCPRCKRIIAFAAEAVSHTVDVGNALLAAAKPEPTPHDPACEDPHDECILGCTKPTPQDHARGWEVVDRDGKPLDSILNPRLEPTVYYAKWRAEDIAGDLNHKKDDPRGPYRVEPVYSATALAEQREGFARLAEFECGCGGENCAIAAAIRRGDA